MTLAIDDFHHIQIVKDCIDPTWNTIGDLLRRLLEPAGYHFLAHGSEYGINPKEYVLLDRDNHQIVIGTWRNVVDKAIEILEAR